MREPPLDPARLLARSRRGITIALIALTLSVLAGVAGLRGWYPTPASEARDQGVENQQLLEDVKTIVEFVKASQSPEVRQRQEAFLNSVLVRIDCNDAARLQIVVDELVKQGLVDSFDVTGSCGAAPTPNP